jgi:hypothetical protein
MAKLVSEAFKEVHQKSWAKANPSGKDIIQQLIESYKTEARWMKAVQHLREAGQLEDSPRDIGSLIKEARADLLKECADDAKERLFGWAWSRVERGSVAGLAEWYKNQLLEQQFVGESST